MFFLELLRALSLALAIPVNPVTPPLVMGLETPSPNL
jgi:hypothetical protein